MTIKDIARLSGVSVSTVSRVLNHRPDVSEESRKRVLSVIEAEHYVPNDSARDLVRVRSDGVGLIVRGVQNPFFTEIIYAIEARLEAAGYTMVMRQIRSGADELAVGAAMEREKRLRGLIFLGGRSDYRPADVAHINVPFVLCTYSNRFGSLDPERYSSVSIDDEETARRAVAELIGKGHRRIAALISDADDSSISELRYRGYCRALREADIPLREELVFSTGESFGLRRAYESMREGMNRCGDFSALFAIADTMAIGAMRALREQGRETPRDCSVISIDGLEVSDYLHPTLATMSQPQTDLGATAADLLLRLVEGRGRHEQRILPAVLRPGASVCAI